MFTIIVFILILGILVLVHEFGHFIAAKKNGIMVEEFGFGFPPRLFSIKIGETLYSINLLPIGGFVKVYGEEYHEEDKLKAPTGETKILKDRAFVYKEPWQKTIVIVAGIIGNFLLGWAIISYLFTQGVPTPTDKVIIEKVQQHSPAAQTGLKENDVLVRITYQGKNYALKSSSDLQTFAKQFGDQQITLSFQRNNQPLQVVIIPRKHPPEGQGSLGVVVTNYEVRKYPWYQAPYFGLIQAATITKSIVVELLKTLGQLLTFHKPAVQMSGPIGIAQYTGQAIKFGSNAVLELMALLSLNLAIVNILPFPALDGGRLVFIIYEWITKRRVNKDFEKYMNMIGIIILLSLTVLISYFDILKLTK